MKSLKVELTKTRNILLLTRHFSHRRHVERVPQKCKVRMHLPQLAGLSGLSFFFLRVAIRCAGAETVCPVIMQRRDLIFRVFVSSTFSDLIAERDALEQRVYPWLARYCQRYGGQFQAVDLRWGVSEEAVRDQQTMNLCLTELRLCQDLSPRPNFIVLLGERYGWRPLPPQIEAGEFETLRALVAEVDLPLLNQWYRQDKNAVPAQFVLQPRHVVVPPDGTEVERYAASNEEDRQWAQDVEPALRRILLGAVARAFPDVQDARRHKYEWAATHQEIAAGAMESRDVQSHVFGYFRTIADLPAGPEAKGFRDLLNDVPDEDAVTRMAKLKRDLKVLLPANHVYEYRAQWREGRAESDLKALCRRVKRNLFDVIRQELRAFRKGADLAREVEVHEEFGLERCRNFVGQTSVLARIDQYLQSPETDRPLLIFGAGGTGKTALVAKAVIEARRRHPEAMVIMRLIGVTPGSVEVRSLLEGVCEQIAQEYKQDLSAHPIPGDFHELVRDFPKRLALASASRPLVIFLDALDQLSSADSASLLGWLPQCLPPHVRLVISALDAQGEAGAALAAARSPAA